MKATTINRLGKRILYLFHNPYSLFLLSVLSLTSCSDTWDDHYNSSASDVKEGTLWDAIKQNSNLSNFASVIEACGYDKSLGSSQVFTVFAPTNDAFSSAEASELIKTYNAEKSQVDDDDNTTVKEFLQNHIALYNHSVSTASNDSIVMMNGKYVILSSNKIGESGLLSTNELYGNGILHTVGKKVEYFPNVFEYLRKDSDLDSLSNFFYSDRFYRKEFQPEKSIAGGIVDGKTVYLDSVFQQRNDLFEYDFLDASLNKEDSTYWIVAPTNEVWCQLIENYTPYFNYDNTVADRDSLLYTNPRMAIIKGTAFSRTNNTDAALQDSAFSTNAYSYTWRRSKWGSTALHYYQFGNAYNCTNKPYSPEGLFNGTTNVECSNGQVMKANKWSVNPLQTFYKWIIIEAEGQGSIKKVSTVTNQNTGEEEETITPKPRTVESNNPYYNKVWSNSFVEFEPTRTTVNHSVIFNITDVLSNIGYDIYLVTAPILANDSNATEIQRLPTKLRCKIGYNDVEGKAQEETLVSSIETTPDETNYLLLAEDYKFPTCSYGLEESEPQVTLQVETRVTSTDQRKGVYTRTMMIDCIMLVPHGTAFVDENCFTISPHGDGIYYQWKKK